MIKHLIFNNDNIRFTIKLIIILLCFHCSLRFDFYLYTTMLMMLILEISNLYISLNIVFQITKSW